MNSLYDFDFDHSPRSKSATDNLGYSGYVSVHDYPGTFVLNWVQAFDGHVKLSTSLKGSRLTVYEGSQSLGFKTKTEKELFTEELKNCEFKAPEYPSKTSEILLTKGDIAVCRSKNDFIIFKIGKINFSTWLSQYTVEFQSVPFSLDVEIQKQIELPDNVKALHQELESLKTLLQITQTAHTDTMSASGSLLGHNNPPPEFALDTDDKAEIISAIDNTNDKIIDISRGDFAALKTLNSKLHTANGKICLWLKKHFDMFSEEAAKSMGKAAGPIIFTAAFAAMYGVGTQIQRMIFLIEKTMSG